MASCGSRNTLDQRRRSTGSSLTARLPLLFTEGVTAALTGSGDDAPDLGDHAEQAETIYDGANAYVRAAGRWTGFSLADPGGTRAPGDALWPLDALFGARDDAVESGREAVRGVPVTRCRLVIDLARADVALPAGVSVPSGPYRSLSRLPAEVWLDADASPAASR